MGTANITVNVGGNALGVNAASVTLRVVPAFSDVLVNGTNFGLNDGFPTTGFIGAEFTLNVTGLATDYNWSSSNPSWVNVDSNGKVSFIAEGNSSPVTITATPVAGGKPLNYDFTVTDWFISDKNSAPVTASAANNYCVSTLSIEQPTRLNLTIGQRAGGSNALWSEWGDLRAANYPNASFLASFYWTSEVSSSDWHYIVRLDNGLINDREDVRPAPVVCLKKL